MHIDPDTSKYLGMDVHVGTTTDRHLWDLCSLRQLRCRHIPQPLEEDPPGIWSPALRLQLSIRLESLVTSAGQCLQLGWTCNFAAAIPYHRDGCTSRPEFFLNGFQRATATISAISRLHPRKGNARLGDLGLTDGDLVHAIAPGLQKASFGCEDFGSDGSMGLP